MKIPEIRPLSVSRRDAAYLNLRYRSHEAGDSIKPGVNAKPQPRVEINGKFQARVMGDRQRTVAHCVSWCAIDCGSQGLRPGLYACARIRGLDLISPNPRRIYCSNTSFEGKMTKPIG